jgi:hypothetical protein
MAAGYPPAVLRSAIARARPERDHRLLVELAMTNNLFASRQGEAFSAVLPFRNRGLSPLTVTVLPVPLAGIQPPVRRSSM